MSDKATGKKPQEPGREEDGEIGLDDLDKVAGGVQLAAGLKVNVDMIKSECEFGSQVNMNLNANMVADDCVLG